MATKVKPSRLQVSGTPQVGQVPVYVDEDSFQWGPNGTGDVVGPASSTDGDIVLFDGTTGKTIQDSGKKLSDYQEKLTAQTAYTSQGTSSKVPQITTNSLGQVTGITEVNINYPSQVDNTAYANSWDGVTGVAPSKNAVYDKINSIDALIPSAATSSNQLSDKDYVNDSINSITAYYITKNAQGDQFATYAQLAAATTFYSGGVVRVPTRNDYCIVQADENHDNATTRYIYQNNQWEYQYTVNETALTQAQLDALNSGITANKVSTYDGYATSKQDALSTQTAYTSQGSATKVPQITTNTLGQVTGITEVTITHPSQVSDTAYGSGWDGVTSTAPSQNAVYDKISAMDTTISGKQNALSTQTAYTAKGSATKVPQITTNTLGQVTGITEVTITQPDISGKQDKATTGSTAPSSTPTYVGQQYVDTANDKLYFATGTSSSSDWTEAGSGGGGGDVLVSSQANNILTSGMKIWAGTQANYENLGTYDNNTLYLTIE